jgi:hypothetical protein
MMPPTVRTCTDMAGFAAAAEALSAAAGRTVTPVQPRLVVEGDELWLETEEEPA